MRDRRPVLVLIGFTAVVAQIVLMREMLVLAGGSEASLGVMLACWLLWTAAGSGVLGRARASNPTRRTAALETALALAMPCTVLAVRAAKGALQAVPGELMSPSGMLVGALAVCAPFCLLSGWLFAAGSRMYAVDAGASTARATATVYLLEAAGSAVGGVLASLVLIQSLDAVQISLLLALLNLMAAAWLWFESAQKRRLMLALIVVAFGGVVFPVGARWLEGASLGWLWRPFQITALRNSIYGNLIVTEKEGSAALFENGLYMVTAPDPQAAEEAVHYALLQHPAPETLLLIGGGINGSLAEALKHPTLRRADYVELDPAILDLASAHFRNGWDRVRSDRRVRLHAVDGRLFVKTAAELYDVIIINLPEPQTAQLNRFYTVEFFREAARRLRSGGILSFRIPSSENYISQERAALLRCLYKTLGAAFEHRAFMPGDPVHFFASNGGDSLVRSADALLDRLASRGVETRYVREYYLPFRMSAARMESLAAALEPRADTPINRDFAPVAYYFGVVLWTKQHGQTASEWMQRLAGAGLGTFIGAAVLGAFLLVLLVRRPGAVAASAVTSLGFTMIGLEILLLLGFQAVYGYVYHQLAMVIALFMAGMAVGSWWGVRWGVAGDGAAGLRRLALLQSLAASAPLLVCFMLEGLIRIRSRPALAFLSAVLFPVFAFFSGLIGGYQFPLASRLFYGVAGKPGAGAGTLYALDLAGSCLGAVVFSALLIPLFGFWNTALIMAAVCFAPALAAHSHVLRTPGP